MKKLFFLSCLLLLSYCKVQAQKGTTCEDPIILFDASSSILAPHESSQTIYYRFTPSKSQEGLYRLSSCGMTSEDTKLEISEGSCSSLTTITSSDDDCGTQSLASFYAKAGQTYTFSWTNYDGENNSSWSFTKLANTEGFTCETPKVLNDTSSSILAPHADIGSQGIYYSFTPTQSQEGIYRLSSCGMTSENTSIEISEGSCSFRTTITSSEDDCGSQSLASFYAEPGQTYFFVWLNHTGANNYSWSFTKKPDGFSCETPIVLSDTSSSILAPYEGMGSKEIYYRFTPTQSQEGEYQLSSCGMTSDNTTIEVLAGSCSSSSLIAWAYNNCDLQSSISFYAEYGQTYIFRWYNNTGENNYNWSFTKAASQEGGLNCEAPIVLSNISSSILAPHADLVSNDIYYRFKPSQGQEGEYQLSSCGMTSENTWIGVYEGSCSFLSTITSSDDDCDLQSSVSFYAEFGQTYIFRWYNNTGKNNYAWSFTKVENLEGGLSCEAPIVLSDTSSSILAPHADLAESDIYYRFTPKQSQEGVYQLSNCGMTSSDTRVFVYEGSCISLSYIIWSNNSCDMQSSVLFFAEYGKSYSFKWVNSSGQNNYNWSFTKKPDGFNCQAPIVLSDTSSSILAPHADLATSNIYYRFTPTQNQDGVYQLSNCGMTSDNTKIEVSEGTCSSLSSITWSDNSCDMQSSAFFHAEYGKSYSFWWKNFDEANNYDWSFTKVESPEDGLICESPIVLSDTSSSILAPHADLATDILYYQFTPTQSQEGVYQLSNCGMTSDDTRIGVFEGNCSSLSPITWSNNCCGIQSSAFFFAEYGKTYTFKWSNNTYDGVNNYSWSFTKVENPEGLSCRTPIVLNDTSTSIIAPHADLVSNSIYYQFTTTQTQEGVYKLSSCGMTSDDTKLVVFEGNCSSLTTITSSDDACAKQSSGSFYAEFGKTYTFRWIDSTGANNYTWSFIHEDNPEYVTSMWLSEDSLGLRIGQEKVISLNKYPSNAAYRSLSYLSSDTTVAKVDERTGMIRALSAGDASIIVSMRTADTLLLDSCRIHVYSNQSNLEHLSLSSGILSPAFHPDSTAYEVLLSSRISTLDIVALAQDSKALVLGSGTFSLVKGENLFSVTVKAEDQVSEKTYQIKVIYTYHISKGFTPAFEITIYPNPVKEVLYIKSEERIEELWVYSLEGKLLMNQKGLKNNQLQISSLAKGIYLIRLKSPQAEHIQQFVKQ